VGEGQDAAHGLGPGGHAPEGKHEAGEEHGGQEEKEGHLHGLELIAGQGAEGDAQGQVGADEDQYHGAE